MYIQKTNNQEAETKSQSKNPPQFLHCNSDAITLPFFERLISGKSALNTAELCLTKKVVF